MRFFEKLIRLLRLAVGRCIQILETGKGTIQPGTGMAEFIVRYRAIVYRPFKGETVDGVVGNVNKVGLCNPETLSTTVSRPCLCAHRALQMGFFAEVGPLNVFVSSHVS